MRQLDKYKNKTELIYYPEGKVEESYTVPSTVKKVADSAFFENSIAKVTISEGVTHIGNAAFSGCENLKEISIPASVTHIGTEAFSRCARISSFKADKNNRYYSSDSYGVLFNKDKTELIQYAVGNSAKSYTIPDSVSVVGRESFSG